MADEEGPPAGGQSGALGDQALAGPAAPGHQALAVPAAVPAYPYQGWTGPGGSAPPPPGELPMGAHLPAGNSGPAVPRGLPPNSDVLWGFPQLAPAEPEPHGQGHEGTGEEDAESAEQADQQQEPGGIRNDIRADGEPEPRPAIQNLYGYALRSLGWLEEARHPMFAWLEWQYLRVIHLCLTEHWAHMQSGADDIVAQQWFYMMQMLELDRKVKMELFLLCQSGKVGRAYANKILFETLSCEALQKPYRTLSNLVSVKIKKARRLFDRPPREANDLRWWVWSCYVDVTYDNLGVWSPDAVPAELEFIRVGDGRQPLKPPQCWGMRGDPDFHLYEPVPGGQDDDL